MYMTYLCVIGSHYKPIVLRVNCIICKKTFHASVNTRRSLDNTQNIELTLILRCAPETAGTTP